MSLRSHAELELDAVGMTADSTDEMNKAMREHILKMVDTFAEEGHSGFSASYAISILEKLLRFQPLVPLTGEDSEWTDVSNFDGSGNKLFQNKRCSRVFKDDTGVWDIDGKVFVEPDGVSYTNGDSRVPVTFPYTPTTEYIKVAKAE